VVNSKEKIILKIIPSGYLLIYIAAEYFLFEVKVPKANNEKP